MSLKPTATYKSNDIEHSFDPGDGPHTTNGKTTQISDIVINAGGEDRDKPSEHNDTPLGNLRAAITTLQDQINEFLTDRMKLEKTNNENGDDDIERKVLDEGVEENEED
ncbi:GON7 [Candida pseudojiufengensis]|uniref:GON7 n=1 Tax=Candida pseudojiufengensis TaxID=497109 RepID=UPI0022249D20|nr:GON7 [Candida pseudojiufengensis]KAI5959561.1 GON7 [Candida pseudojiufengensis]